MRWHYKLKKRWFSFLQKYKLKAQLRNVRKLFIFLFLVWFSGSLLTIASQWAFAREQHQNLQAYLKYFWIVIIELVSGFDIPGDVELHVASQLISILMLIMGLVVVGLFTGQIISMFVHVLQKSELFPEKPENFQFEKPVNVCGCNERVYNIIENIRWNSRSVNREIILVDEQADQFQRRNYAQADDIWFLKGDPADRQILKKEIGRRDCRVIILSKDLQDKRWSNAISINTALAIEAFDENVHTVVEIVDKQSMGHFQRTKINDWVCVSEFSLKLIAQSALQPGMSNVYSAMLGNGVKARNSTRIRFSDAPLAPEFVGKTYTQVARIFREELAEWDVTLIGFAKYLRDSEKEKYDLTLRNSNYFIQINPPGKINKRRLAEHAGKLLFDKQTVLTNKDQLVYIAAHEISFEKI